MNNWTGLLHNELFKIYIRPRTWFMAAALLALLLFMAFISIKLTPPQYEMSAVEFMLQSVNMMVIVFLFTVIVAAEIVAGEFTWGTVKLLLIRPHSRGKILLTKYAAVLLFMLAMSALLFVYSAVIGLLLFQGGGLQLDVGNAPGFQRIVQEYGLAWIKYGMLTTLAFMLSTIFRSSSVAIGVSLLVLFVAPNIVTVLSHYNYRWVKFTLFANTDFSMYMEGGRPLLSGMTPAFSIVVLAVHYVFFLGLSWYMFKTRDVSF